MAATWKDVTSYNRLSKRLGLLCVLIVLLAGCGGGDSWLDHPYYKERVEALNNYEGDCEVIFLGDSRIEGGAWAEHNPTWCNFGIGGDFAYGMAARLDAVIKHHATVVVQGGYNGLNEGLSIPSILRNLDYIKATLEANGSTVYITSTLLTYWPNINLLIGVLNSQQEGLLDINGVLAPDGYLVDTYDGVHLTEAGYEDFYQVIDDYGL